MRKTMTTLFSGPFIDNGAIGVYSGANAALHKRNGTIAEKHLREALKNKIFCSISD